MALVLHRQMQRVLPAVQADVHLDRAVDPPVLQQDLDGLVGLAAQQRELGRLEHLGWRAR